MAQQSSVRQFGRAVDGSSNSVVRPITVALALLLAMVVVGLLICGGRSSRVALFSAVTESSSRPSTAGAGIPEPDDDAGSRSNNDGYVEGLRRAMGL